MNLDAVSDAIDKVGQPVTLRRIYPRGLFFDVQTKAIIKTFRNRPANALAGDAVQIDVRCIIHNRDIDQQGWPGPPRKGDQIIIDGVPSTLEENPDTTQVGDVIVKHVLRIRGG